VGPHSRCPGSENEQSLLRRYMCYAQLFLRCGGLDCKSRGSPVYRVAGAGGIGVAPHAISLLRNCWRGYAAPHGPSQKKNLAGVSSTHTFMLHLADCEAGGETVFLERLPPVRGPMNILAKAQPRRGRLLLFPHLCPHAGLPVLNLPPRKLFLRGELLCESGRN